MKTKSQFVRDARALSAFIHNVINNKNLSMNEISKMTGLAVPTIARIYHEKVDKVQLKTVRMLVGGLGYDYSVSQGGQMKIKERSQPKEGRLTNTQKERILKTLVSVLRKELDRL